MSAAHTPGPWFYEYTRIGHTVRQSPTAPLSLMVVNHSENPEADGRLIAAAPELLEALDLITKVYAGLRETLAAQYPNDGWSIDTMTLDEARAALAKARGAA